MQPTEPVFQRAARHGGVQRPQGHRGRSSASRSALRKLHENVRKIRDGLRKLGYECQDSPTAIIPILIGDTAEAIAKSKRLMELGAWVVGFGYPVVPQGQARLRVQVSAALEDAHIERALDAFGRL